MASTTPQNTVFVLGGDDGEMVAIKSLLARNGFRFAQPKTGWGDHVYTPQEVGWNGEGTVVFVECRPGESWGDTEVKIVDHHGPRSAQPASILQVIDLLGLKLQPTDARWAALVAANDSGYIPAMLAAGATTEEVLRVRAEDRRAHGVTPGHESEAERAIAARVVMDRLTVVRMTHSKTATVADRLFGQYDQLLILSTDGESNFYGDGALCKEMHKAFEGWSGGAGLGKAGQNAYWGSGSAPQEEVAEYARKWLEGG